MPMVRSDGVRALSAAQREKVAKAVRDARAYVQRHGPVPCDARNIFGEPKALRYDVISLAVDTRNEWWQGLTNRQIAVVTRLIHTILARGDFRPGGVRVR